MVSDVKDSNLSKLEFLNVPGGPPAFELAAKFCYGMNFEINTGNVAQLRCVAEYLEMTDDYRDENLVSRTETYLDEVVAQSLEKSVQVLSSCELLSPMADEVGIPDKCVDAIALNASKEQLTAGFSRLDCEDESAELKNSRLQWWIEDLSGLKIEFYRRIIVAMGRTGVEGDSIVGSLMHYAQTSLKGIGKNQIWHPTRTKPSPGRLETDQRAVVETLVSLLPPEKSSGSSVPLSFLFGMLRMAIFLVANVACRLELERRIGFRLETVSVDDLLIPSVQTGDSLFDVDTVHRILVNFLQRIEEEENEEYGYEMEVLGSPSQGSILKVGSIIDSFLAEIAPDPYLNLQKFTAMLEILPDYARVIDDGLYRAVDIYLKVRLFTLFSRSLVQMHLRWLKNRFVGFRLLTEDTS